MSESFSVTLDRIEGEVAVLLCGDDPVYIWHVPCNYLPADAKEGERLRCRLSLDPRATADAEARNAALLEQLTRPPAT